MRNWERRRLAGVFVFQLPARRRRSQAARERNGAPCALPLERCDHCTRPLLADQRGTGGSNPLTRAPHLRSPQEYLNEMYPVEYVKALRAELERLRPAEVIYPGIPTERFVADVKPAVTT